MNQLDYNIALSMPNWAIEELSRLPSHFPTLEDRMEQVIRFSELNFRRATGGPFAAGVFERDSGKLLVIGVNRVMASNCSSAHAEIMALSLAQKAIGTYDLGGKSQPAYQLVVNWRPCAMCYGATIWSGIRSLVIAGSGSELEKLTGFDEGPVHPDWQNELRKRGIDVVSDILRDEACRVFKAFGESNSFVYNARLGEA